MNEPERLHLTTTSLQNVIISSSNDKIYYEVVTPKWDASVIRVSKMNPKSNALRAPQCAFVVNSFAQLANLGRKTSSQDVMHAFGVRMENITIGDSVRDGLSSLGNKTQSPAQSPFITSIDVTSSSCECLAKYDTWKSSHLRWKP